MNVSSKRVLVIDDQEEALLSLVRALKVYLPTLTFCAATNEEKGLTLLRTETPAAVVMDLCLDDTNSPRSGYALLKEILLRDPTIRVIVLTGYRSGEAGVKCLELGASSFLEKPPDVPHLAALIKDGVTQTNLKRAYTELYQRVNEPALATIVGRSECAIKLMEAIQFAASNNQSILISGDTGTGKGLCALTIHNLSKRNGAKFIRYQPQFGTPDLINSDLFGHVKGAFTGANSDRVGLIEEARGGTLFLDEVDELPLETQISLLGVMQDRTYRAVGSNNEINADFRLISATNRDIDEILSKKKLRQDFYHRIAHFQIHIPPLRDRPDDIPELASYFLAKLRERESVSVFEIAEDALSKLRNYNWPGNIRELQAVIESGAYKAQFKGNTLIEADDIALGRKSSNNPLTSDLGFHAQVENFKITVIQEALKRNGGNQVKAAQELKMDRSSMRRILERSQADNVGYRTIDE